MSASGVVLVTGATGVVGRLPVPRLVAARRDVVAVGRTPDKRTWLESMGARAVALDLFDGEAATRVLAEGGVEVVVNLATHMPASVVRMMLPWAWRENDRVRREGSATLVDAALAAGVRRFVQESFAPVYEDGGDAWIDESWPVRPGPYNGTVLDAEQSTWRFTEAGGIGVVLRFAGFYGPDPFLGASVGAVKRGWSPLPGPGGAYWSAICHEDAASAAAAALDVPAGVYNACDDDPAARSDFAATLAGAVGVAPPRSMPRWMNKVGGKSLELLSRSQRMSNAKLRRAAGWSPRWRSIREGIPAAVDALTGAADPPRAQPPVVSS